MTQTPSDHSRPPKGGMDLADLLRGMSATLDPEVYVFATLPASDIPEGLSSKMVFQEAEGTALILTRTEAEARGIPYDFPCRCITLQVHSALEAVGFLAAITRALAAQGMGVNPVAGYFHDHLFVPDGRQDDAMVALQNLARTAGAT